MYQIVTFSDYSPFGVQLSGRTFTASGVTKKYRRGYQGSEMDNEVKSGEGNSYTTEFRQLDPRLGRWLSIDPKVSSMPWQSPYCSMDNNPVLLNDPLGDWTEKTANRKAERAKKHGYKTKVMENPDKEGDYGVRFRAKNNGVYYEKTQYEGKFRGIGRKGIVKNGFKEANLIDMGELTSGGNVSDEEMKTLEPLDGSFGLTGQTSGWYTPTSNTNGGIGVISSGIEAVPGTYRLSTTTRGFSPKYYGNAWRGNQYTSTLSVTKTAKFVGRGTFILGLVFDGVGVYEYYQDPTSPDAVHPAKAGLNTGMGIYGFFNPFAAAMYYGMDAFYPGGWKGLAEDQDRLDRENKAVNPYWQLWPANKNM